LTSEPAPRSGRYQWLGWTIPAASSGDVHAERLMETHEYFHRQLDDTTAFGGLVTTIASLVDSVPDPAWGAMRDRLQAMSDLVHETFAVGMSLLTTQRPIAPIRGYPMYDRYVELVWRLTGPVHPWVTLAALRAAATACMQSPALSLAARAGLERFDPRTVPLPERPNHRLAALLASGYPRAVVAAQDTAQREHGGEPWWIGTPQITLTPESIDGEPGLRSQALHRELLTAATDMLREAGADVVEAGTHLSDLADLLRQADDLAPSGLARIGALLEAPDTELLHGGALDSQTITLSAAPSRGTVLPYGSVSGLSGEGTSRHGFVTLVRPERLRSSYWLQGIPLPERSAVACLRTTVFSGEERDSVLFVIVESPEQLAQEPAPIYVSLTSSAAAAAPEQAAAWMAFADGARLSLVMDTPATAALRRWCSQEGARLRTATRRITLDDMDVRMIVGRVEQTTRRSALIVIPTTEFGARWFESVVQEDPLLNAKVIVDPRLFEEEADHLEVVINHLLFEEHLLGTGSWRQ
jgi:hypothetical protein